MSRYSLDTNTISKLLRKDDQVVQRFREAAVQNDDFVLCPYVYYELRRGLLKKDATRQLLAMEELMSGFVWTEFERELWAKAAQGWAEATRSGRPAQDPDLLIAYHAYHFAAILVTNNTSDFQHFPIKLEDWT